jgi:SpoVK/Ycf46/Vps4 family AAA+-type ATPase
MMSLGDPSLAHLLGRLESLEVRVRAAVAARRETDPAPDDPFRGLYLSAEAVDRVLAGRHEGETPAVPSDDISAVEHEADQWEAAGAVLRLRRLQRVFSLDARDVALLLVAIAPDLDARFERLYGYLNDDVTRRRATIGLALELAGLSPLDGEARVRLSAGTPLVRDALLLIEDADRPLLGRSLRVPDRVTSHLLGMDRPEPDLLEVLEPAFGPTATARSAALERALRIGAWPVHLREAGMASGSTTAAASVAALEAPSLIVDLARVAATSRPAEIASLAVREARLLGAVLVATGVDAAAEHAPRLIGQIAEAAVPTILVGSRTWDPAWSSSIPTHLDAPAPEGDDRRSVWAAALATSGDAAATNGHAQSLLAATDAFRLTAPQVARATRSARIRAVVDERTIEPSDLQAGARAQNAAGLDRLARRVEPQAEWRDLVLPPESRSQLEELAIRARHRERVLDDWGIGARSSRGRGITALFAGESGTGKTLAAEVIARQLGLDLYVIDLSTVIDKYIGETEKNLDRIFSEADRVNGVLLFDEADAIFGKRSEVRDARDRYANVEVAYLLQRMERFNGLAVLTTNLRANLDDAFTRRIDVIVDFPMPEEDDRLELWRMHLPAGLPQGDDLDLPFMARRFRLSGGNIRNVCLSAAFLAADAGGVVTMADLIRATEREYRKLGRLTVEAEFGPYFDLLSLARGRGG